MKKNLLLGALLAAGCIFGADVSVGVRIGPPPPPRVVVTRPAAPGPDWAWVDGYWYPVGNRYEWHEGYWSRPPYPAARWIGPRYDHDRYYEGYWEGERGRVRHDHGWDRDRDRDFDRERRDRDRDHGRDRDRR